MIAAQCFSAQKTAIDNLSIVFVCVWAHLYAFMCARSCLTMRIGAWIGPNSRRPQGGSAAPNK